MNALNTTLILAAAFLAAFGEAAFPVLRHWLGAQVDLLPALMVYSALNTDIVTVSLLAVSGGLWFDALSANPLGISIMPLFAVGFVIYLQRELILRELPFAKDPERRSKVETEGRRVETAERVAVEVARVAQA